MSVIQNNLLMTPEGYQISRSVRVRSSASANFTRTPAGAGNRRTWTWSSWVKRGRLGADQDLFGYYTSGLNESIRFGSNDTLYRYCVDTSGTVNRVLLNTNAVYRDTSAWYHIMVVQDTTQATNTDRVKIYVNGVQQSVSATVWPALNWDGYFNTVVNHQLFGSSGLYFDGYQTETFFIDGQALTPASFGETDAVTGVWKPKKYAGTYGTNGFYLNFSDNSNNTAATIGKDYSGNGNNWTPNNISVTAGATYDSMLDTPTPYADGGNGRGNYAVLNPLLGGVNNAVMTNGNLTATLTYSSQVNAYSNMPLPTTGKWYWESTVVASNYGVSIGIRSTVNASLIVAASTGGYSYYNANGNKYDGSTASAYGTSWYGASRTDVIGVAYDAVTRELSFYLNGVSQGVAFTVVAGEYYPSASHVSGSGSHTEHFNFGQRPFAYTPPTGFKALNTQNLPDATIKKGNQYFDAKLYTGNGATQNITGMSFSPDLVWTKARSSAISHGLFDTVRGAGKALYSNVTNAEYDYGTTTAGELYQFTSDGFSLGSSGNFNANGVTNVAWQWKESVTAGFDIVTYTGNGSTQNVAHSLGVAPSMMIVKGRTNVDGWSVYHQSRGATIRLSLSSTAADLVSSAYWNNTAPSSSVFTVGTNSSVNSNGVNYVAYLFAEVAGFSKFGSYTGNGSADGPFVYCGFRPRFIMLKRTDSTGNWNMFDSSRNGYNQTNPLLFANTSDAEYTTAGAFEYDILSNGFKVRNTGTGVNASGATVIYMAFAENPFKNSLAR